MVRARVLEVAMQVLAATMCELRCGNVYPSDACTREVCLFAKGKVSPTSGKEGAATKQGRAAYQTFQSNAPSHVADRC